MAEAKFTKGEWFIEKDANWNDDCWAISVKRDYDDSIHHCFAEVTYKMEHEVRNIELEANAHLIAAAPEMYEEIEREYSALLHEIQNCINPEKVKILRTVADRKSKILAKARGEQNA